MTEQDVLQLVLNTVVVGVLSGIVTGLLIFAFKRH